MWILFKKKINLPCFPKYFISLLLNTVCLNVCFWGSMYVCVFVYFHYFSKNFEKMNIKGWWEFWSIPFVVSIIAMNLSRCNKWYFRQRTNSKTFLYSNFLGRVQQNENSSEALLGFHQQAFICSRMYTCLHSNNIPVS